MAEGTHNLGEKIESSKRNIFVTQIDAREDDDDQVVYHPVVSGTADQLLETGFNSMQKTLALRREVERDRVERALQEKRQQFKGRMANCDQQRIKLESERQRLAAEMKRYERSIQEKENRRRKAIMSYQQEARTREQKTRELEMLNQQLKLLTESLARIKRRVDIYKQYKHFLQSVIEMMPANYLEMRENMIDALMMRFRTLAESNSMLLDRLYRSTDELEAAKEEQERLRQSRGAILIDFSTRISGLQKEHDRQVSFNKQLAEKEVMKGLEWRHQREELGRVIMAIDDLCDKCRTSNDPPLLQLSLEAKLRLIEARIIEQADVAARAKGSQANKRVLFAAST